MRKKEQGGDASENNAFSQTFSDEKAVAQDSKRTRQKKFLNQHSGKPLSWQA